MTAVPSLSVARRRRPRPRWVLPASPDAALVTGLAGALRLPELVCALLAGRGMSDPAAAKRFLRPRLEQLHEPPRLDGLERAVERLVRAIRAGEPVMVHGDYDVDGICSTTILLRAIRGFGGRAIPFIPRRLEDGYDLTDAGVRAALAAGARVVVTCDCGTSARGPVQVLCEAGVDVIITDHHLPGGPLPACLAVLNPNRRDADYPVPDRGLAAAGVAFKLALALARALGGSEGSVFAMLDLVALATIADVAPLTGENRILSRYGLRMLDETRNPGLRALIRAAGLDGKPLTAGRVGFILAPRLNAVGRLGHALRGVELLTVESEAEANVIARELEELNRRRQDLDRTTLEEARRLLDRMDLDARYGLVLARAGWHPGVIGIVASRVVEETARPTVLVALDGEEGKGSGRSIPRFDLHAGLSECRDLFDRFGGHRAAAGITIRADRVAAFAERFDAVVRSKLAPDDLRPELRLDLELPIDAVSDELQTVLRHFEPFGPGNPAPLFASRLVRLAGTPRVLKGDALKLRIATARGELEAIGFGLGERAAELDPRRPVDVAFRIERDEWNGASRLQLRLADVRPAGTGD